MPLPIAARTVDAVHDAMETLFAAYWSGRTQIGWQNKKLDRKGLDEYAKFSIVYTTGLSGPVGIENRKPRLFRRSGIVTVVTAVRVGSGEDRSNELLDDALGFFENVDPPEGVWYRNPGPSIPSQDGAFYQVPVTAEFTYDTLRA